MASDGLRESVLSLLNSLGSGEQQIGRCRCGAIVEHRKTTFFYEGQSWEVEFPICPVCSKTLRITSHDA